MRLQILSLVTRRRGRTVFAAASCLFFMYCILCLMTGKQQSETSGVPVYPNIRFVGGKRQAEPPSKEGIPHIIHQTWKTSELPSMLSDWVATWRKNHPDWQYWFWTDDDLYRLVDLNFPHIAPLFKSYPMGGYRADAFRYLVLYIHGGVYADLDMESLQPLDDFFTGNDVKQSPNDITRSHDCILSQEPEEHAHFLAPVGIPLVSNALMACQPGHPFFRDVIATLPDYAGWIRWHDILHATGPYMLTKEYHRYTKSGWIFGVESKTAPIYLAPSKLFQPLVDRSMLDSMRTQCMHSDGSSLSADELHTWRRLCDAIRGKTLMDKPPPEALTAHHFTHTWAGRRYDPWGVFNTRDTVRVETLLARDSDVKPEM